VLCVYTDQNFIVPGSGCYTGYTYGNINAGVF